MPHAYETGWRSNGFRPYSDYTLKLFSIVLPFANPSVIISLMSSTRTPQNAPLIKVLEGFCRVRSQFGAPRAVTMLIGSVLLMTACAWPADDSSDRSPNPNLSPTDPQTASDEALVRAIDPDGPGCAAAVARAGEVVWSGGRGLADVELETPITADTHFDLGSVSKHTTALTVLALASEGLIDIDGTVDQYASELGDWTSDTTVRDLMLHRSGLPDYIELLIEAGQTLDVAASQDDALAALENVSAGRNQPFEYSNSGYVVLAHIVERVTGEPFAQVVHQRLFGPMGSDLVVDPAAAPPNLAVRYASASTLAILTNEWRQVGDGAVVGSVVDLAQWLDVFRTGLPDHPAVTDTATAMTSAFTAPDGSTYHAGIIAGADGSLSHSGGWLGHVALAGVSADRQLTIALACNAPDAGSERLATALLEIWVDNAPQ